MPLQTLHGSSTPPQTLEETLEAIAQSAQTAVPGIDAAGISVMHRDGKIETKAATAKLVWKLDRLQYELGEGPCVDAMREQPIVKVDHVGHVQNWPRFIPRAVEEGLRSQLGVRLYVNDQTLGGLNLYSTTSDTIDPEAAHIAELFAAHAALALGHARTEENLNAALESRKVIGEALGLLMERHQMDDERAFRFLIRVSNTGNIKLRDVAQELVDQANQRAHSKG